MTRDNIFGMKAIVGIVLMLNLVCVPFTNAALAERNTEPVPYTPETTPEWSFGSAEDGAGVATVAAGVMGVVGVQPEFEDSAIQELLNFHVLAFETVFGRAYDGTESAYFFEQPLDESTYATVVPGWNTVGEPVDALVLLAQPIDVSDIEPENGVTIISAAHIAGTLEGIEKQGFWGISLVYDFSDGVRYNDLFLLQDLDETTEKALLANAGLMDYGRGEPDEMQACIEACDIMLQACLVTAYAGLSACTDNSAAGLATCLAACLAVGVGGAVIHPGIGLGAGLICAGICLLADLRRLRACTTLYNGAVAGCWGAYRACMAGCGFTIAARPDAGGTERIAQEHSHDAVITGGALAKAEQRW